MDWFPYDKDLRHERVDRKYDNDCQELAIYIMQLTKSYPRDK